MMPLRLLHPRRAMKLLAFIAFYIAEIVLSNLRVAFDILTPKNYFRPGIVLISLPDLTDTQLIVLTHLVTMTPGTLSLDVSDDRRHLAVHLMYINDPDAERRKICQDYIVRIKELF